MGLSELLSELCCRCSKRRATHGQQNIASRQSRPIFCSVIGKGRSTLAKEAMNSFKAWVALEKSGESAGDAMAFGGR
eukprot:SAG11_NODE_8858_length_969_cov_1.009195_1_plen_77_part_00